MMKTYCNALFMIVLLLMFTGCAALLPHSTITTESPWQDFNGAKLTYDKINPGVTTVSDLKRLGFDPYLTPNIKIMNVTEVINLFLPNPSIKKEDLDIGIQKCIESKDRCTAYQISPSKLYVNRIGNFWLDLFSFKRHTVNSGWEFKGLITIVDNVVTYRDPPGGRPLINMDQIDVKPLGPAQEAGSAIIATVPLIW
ncbi:MAG: hypothetical protein CVU62_13985 [Deltaproteobacteria bacterium HGW-Deltaproteobacteria-2]|nr:MAG: hypothetical protein CVU62_13985 [Deltaproteobacteria bacterium HGW-Deltaproteobacteria-2]